MMGVGKMSQIVERSFNGDAPNVDPAVRRTMYAVADEMDDWRNEMLAEVKGVRKLLIYLVGTVATGLMLAVAQILLQL